MHASLVVETTVMIMRTINQIIVSPHHMMLMLVKTIKAIKS